MPGCQSTGKNWRLVVELPYVRLSVLGGPRRREEGDLGRVGRHSSFAGQGGVKV